jgi:hypothetical protein
MLKVIGNQPPNVIGNLQLAGLCPHCKQGTRFNIATQPRPNLRLDAPKQLVAGYTCDLCALAVPIMWTVYGYDPSGNPTLTDPTNVLRVRETFEFGHVPEPVKKEIQEGLDCLSVSAYNGFAAMCRRTIQSACTSLGAQGTTKVQAQIKEMAELAGLDEETKTLAYEIMLSGHDGAHPHLPDVNADRAAVLLSLVQDLVYQLFTRPGRIQESASLRKQAIGDKK